MPLLKFTQKKPSSNLVTSSSDVVCTKFNSCRNEYEDFDKIQPVKDDVCVAQILAVPKLVVEHVSDSDSDDAQYHSSDDSEVLDHYSSIVNHFNYGSVSERTARSPLATTIGSRRLSSQLFPICHHCELQMQWWMKKQKNVAESNKEGELAICASRNYSDPKLEVSNTTASNLSSANFFLQVPSVCKIRSSSMDDGILQSSDYNTDRLVFEKARAISVDIHMPTSSTDAFVARPNRVLTSSRRQNKKFTPKAIAASHTLTPPHNNNLLHPSHAEFGYQSTTRIWKDKLDWTENASNGEHLWVDTSASGDLCYVGEQDCCKSGTKKKCVACKIIIHIGCAAQLEKINFRCKPTFREASVKNYRDGRHAEQYVLRHHWVHRRQQEGKCKQCSKSFQQKFPFNNKDVIAISCSWCKTAYHNKISCFMMQQIEEQCSMGSQASIIVPPSWIIKIHKKAAVSKSSFRKRGQKNSFKRKKSHKGPNSASLASSTGLDATHAGSVVAATAATGAFVIKPIPSPHIRPVLVFINPKSGGVQGNKLLHKFRWLLNPRQVFDLSENGPKQGLELYRKVSSLRILTGGGDGTVGWILAVIDELQITPCPPVAVLPLGTGNDLARTLNWGSGYTDEPLSKILACVEEGKVVQLDRWNLRVEMNPNGDTKSTIDLESVVTPTNGGASPGSTLDLRAVSQLPLSVFNNYFSLGADAAVALEFHESREANPEKFNSRLRNKMFYAGAGSKNLLRSPWRELSTHISMHCDGVDYTERIRELKLHCLLFLNINRYGAGTTPWGNPTGSMGFGPQRQDDGFLEVIGFTSTSLAAVQVGGHGERLCQCQKVKLVTTKIIPVQVDGEPCRLMPSMIEISRRNQANLVQKPKRRNSVPLITDILKNMHLCSRCLGIGEAEKRDLDYGFANHTSISERLRLQVSVISMTDYENLQYEKERLRQASYPLGIIVVENDSDLETVRSHIKRLAEDTLLLTVNGNTRLSDKWVFLDSTTAERFFRIDKQQECLHFVTDISSEDLHILDPELHVSPQLPELRRQTCSKEPLISVTPEIVTILPNSSTNVFFNSLTPDFYQDQLSTSDNERLAIIHNDCSSSEPTSPTSPMCLKARLPQRLKQRRNSYLASINKNFLESCKRGALDQVQEWHNGGADVTCLDSAGMSGLHHAARFGHKEVLNYLLEFAPILLDLVDDEKKQTALHKAAWHRRRAICQLLVTAGASLTCIDHQGLTPRQQALLANDRELANFLESQEHIQLVKSEDHETAV